MLKLGYAGRRSLLARIASWRWKNLVQSYEATNVSVSNSSRWSYRQLSSGVLFYHTWGFSKNSVFKNHGLVWYVVAPGGRTIYLVEIRQTNYETSSNTTSHSSMVECQMYHPCDEIFIVLCALGSIAAKTFLTRLDGSELLLVCFLYFTVALAHILTTWHSCNHFFRAYACWKIKRLFKQCSNVVAI